MSDIAHEYTDKKIEEIERQFTKIYRRAYKEAKEEAEEYFSKFEKRDKAQKDLLEKGVITEQEYTQWRLAQIGRGKRFEAVRDSIAERLTKTNEIAVDYINGRTPDIFAENRNYMSYELEKEYGNMSFILYDENTVKRLITDNPDLLPAPRINIPKDLLWNKKSITDEITAGILLGDSIDKLANRLQRVADMDRVSAIRNARTALTGAENAGRQDGFNAAAKMGIKVYKRWIATKDNRTRHAHGMADGQIVDYDKPFDVGGENLMYPGDDSGSAWNVYNCRCTMRTVEKEGIEAEPRMMRVKNPATGRNELVSEMTYKEWAAWKEAENPKTNKQKKVKKK